MELSTIYVPDYFEKILFTSLCTSFYANYVNFGHSILICSKGITLLKCIITIINIVILIDVF